MCNRRCPRPNIAGMLCIAFWNPSRAFRTIRCCSLPESLHGSKAWFCLGSCWRACRSGWFSSFWNNSRTLVLCSCFTKECGSTEIRKSMFTSFSIVCSWLKSSWLTSGLPDLSSTVVDTIIGEVSLSIRSSRSRVLKIASCKWWRRAWRRCGTTTLLSWKCPWSWWIRSWRRIWQAWNHNRNEISPCCTVPESQFKRDVFLWPLTHSWGNPFSSQNFPSDNIAGVFSKTFSQEYVHFWHTPLPLHASALLLWRLWLSSSGSGSASSWKLLGHSDGSKATGSFGTHGPKSSDDNKNTKRTIHIFPTTDYEHARSTILFDFHANNVTLECLFGSKNSGQRPTHHSESLPQYIVKQIPCQLSSYSKKKSQMPRRCAPVHGWWYPLRRW